MLVILKSTFNKNMKLLENYLVPWFADSLKTDLIEREGIGESVMNAKKNSATLP